MDIKKLNFSEFTKKVGYGWYIVMLILLSIFIIIATVQSHDITVAIGFTAFSALVGIIIFFHTKSRYSEYLKFIDIVESEDCLLYIPKIKASGQIQGYDFGTDCSIAIKKMQFIGLVMVLEGLMVLLMHCFAFI